MNNIQQITNFSEKFNRGTNENISVIIGDNIRTVLVRYKVLLVQDLTNLDNVTINQIGYVCEPRGIDYPIIVTTDGKEEIFYLGKTGILEFGPEKIKNINMDEDYKEYIPKITKIKIPVDKIEENAVSQIFNPIKFKLDYIFDDNFQ